MIAMDPAALSCRLPVRPSRCRSRLPDQRHGCRPVALAAPASRAEASDVPRLAEGHPCGQGLTTADPAQGCCLLEIKGGELVVEGEDLLGELSAGLDQGWREPSEVAGLLEVLEALKVADVDNECGWPP